MGRCWSWARARASRPPLERLFAEHPEWAEFADRQVAILLAVAPGDHPRQLRRRAAKLAARGAGLTGAALAPRPRSRAGGAGPGPRRRRLLARRLRHADCATWSSRSGATTCSRRAFRRAPAIGRGLDAALEARLDGEISSREEELQVALEAAREELEPILASSPWSGESETGVRWLEAQLPGARAAFSTRLGGVSEAPYEALNVAVKTGDEPRPRPREPPPARRCPRARPRPAS